MQAPKFKWANIRSSARIWVVSMMGCMTFSLKMEVLTILDRGLGLMDRLADDLTTRGGETDVDWCIQLLL